MIDCNGYLRRRKLLFTAAAAAVPSLPYSQSSAASIEPRVTLLSGFTEGSFADEASRVFTGFMARHLPGNELSIRNIPGEAGYTMLKALADAASDGSIIGWVTTPTLPARMIDRTDPSLAQRIQLIGQVEREPVAFVSPSADPATSIQDIIQRAGNDADAVPLATSPPGSPPHLAAIRLQVLAQTRLNIVTFPSAAAAHQAALAGNVSVAVLGLSDVITDVRDGTLTAIGIAAKRRFGLLPDTPILDEAGIPLAATIRRGIAVTAGTAPELVARLTDAARAATAESDFQKKAETSGYYAAWEDGAAWLERMRVEQSILAKLWETDPWLSSSSG